MWALESFRVRLFLGQMEKNAMFSRYFSLVAQIIAPATLRVKYNLYCEPLHNFNSGKTSPFVYVTTSRNAPMVYIQV